MSQHPPIQRVEFCSHSGPVCCPFCGRIVLPDDPDDPAVHPCAHTLFIATDEGFEFRSGRFDALMGLEGVEDRDIDPGEDGWDAYTDRVCCPDSIKIASFIPAPSGFGCYVGFAP